MQKLEVVNISNDTFYRDESFAFQTFCVLYSDTGVLFAFQYPVSYLFSKDFLPDDSNKTLVGVKFDLLYAINRLKEARNIDFEHIKYWKSIVGVIYTDRDGAYSDSVFWAGADTSIFYVVKGGVGVNELTIDNEQLTIYPNPTSGQLHITMRHAPLWENEAIEIYDVLGRKQEIIVNYQLSTINSIDASHLPSGMYFLKIGNRIARFVKE